MQPTTVLGQDVVNHLDAWLDREMSSRMAWQDVANLRDIMLRMAAADSDWLDRGWWKLYDNIVKNRA